MNSNEIARIAKVSRSTVSRVINGHGNVSPETREHVESVIRQLNYVPDASARNLVGKPNKIIGLFIMDFQNPLDEFTICRSPFYNSYLTYVVDIVNRLGYNLLVIVIRKDNLEEMYKLFGSKTIAGGIIMGDYVESEKVNDLLNKGYKIVLYNQREKSDHENLIVVNYDNHKCGKIACDELIKRGHKKIGHITGPREKLSIQGRLQGMLTSMKLAGIEFSPEKYLSIGSYHREEGGYEATKRLIKNNSNDLPTALLISSGIMGIGALNAIADMGLNVPNDISLISIDGIEISKYTSPPLTEVQISPKNVALITASKLIDFLENNIIDNHDFEISDASLIIRDSILDLSR